MHFFAQSVAINNQLYLNRMQIGKECLKKIYNTQKLQKAINMHIAKTAFFYTSCTYHSQKMKSCIKV